jgi:hypothetical protein
MDGIACADYSTAVEDAMNQALTETLSGVDESGFGAHVCTDVLRRRALKTSSVSVFIEVSVDAAEYADDDVVSAMSSAVDAAVTTGALESSVISYASTAGTTLSVTFMGSSIVAITPTPTLTPTSRSESGTKSDEDAPMTDIIVQCSVLIVLLVVVIAIVATVQSKCSHQREHHTADEAATRTAISAQGAPAQIVPPESIGIELAVATTDGDTDGDHGFRQDGSAAAAQTPEETEVSGTSLPRQHQGLLWEGMLCFYR